jgi:hypothetical protein
MSDVTKEELRNVLHKWQAGNLEPQEVLEWAEDHYDLATLKDEVVVEILTCLDTLHLNLVTVEDVPTFLKMLDIPPERKEDALNILKRHDENVDWEGRKAKYKQHPFYGIFCDD